MITRVGTVNTAAQTMFGFTPKVAAMVWLQGEEYTTSGANLTTAQYAAALDDLIAHVRTDLSVSTLPVVVYSLVLDWCDEFARPTNRWRIQDALNDTPARVQRVPTSTAHAAMPDATT
jgi:hypothetical protein